MCDLLPYQQSAGWALVLKYFTPEGTLRDPENIARWTLITRELEEEQRWANEAEAEEEVRRPGA